MHAAPDRLSLAAHREIANSVELSVSVVTLYETHIAVARGRIGFQISADEMMDQWLKETPTKLLPVTAEIARAASTLPFRHQDPLDRIISATAFYLQVPLITADENLRRLDWLQTVW